VEELTIRLLPYEVGDGPTEMAADEVMLRSAALGQASLRFYGWDRPTLSLGYFQPERGRFADPLLAELPFVRRATGGLALVHHHELTYCLALPAAQPWRTGVGWLRMHEIIAAALADHGVRVSPHVPEGDDTHPFLCFKHFTAGDLMIGLSKVVGSAQRKQKGALLQHGSILLGTSRFAERLTGIRELTHVVIDPVVLAGYIIRHLEEKLGWHVQPGGWTAEERRAIAELAESRYRSEEWNRKR
jgi:lipoate-protein ligase A